MPCDDDFPFSKFFLTCDLDLYIFNFTFTENFVIIRGGNFIFNIYIHWQRGCSFSDRKSRLIGFKIVFQTSKTNFVSCNTLHLRKRRLKGRYIAIVADTAENNKLT